ncbi:hypothetical protein, partial [Shewanella algicola]|uniref:hypothetical protein n=1 Tax=Shewanella algicola TaxID=640633 RepID=UPI001E48923A
NPNDCIGKTLRMWPVFVDHYTVSQGNTLLTQGFLGLSFLIYCFTLIVVFDATHLPLKEK